MATTQKRYKSSPIIIAFLGTRVLNQLIPRLSDKLNNIIGILNHQAQTSYNCSSGQRYDGAAAMKGEKNSLKTKILADNDNSMATYIHCYGHSLQLAVQDATKACRTISGALDICSEISSLIRKSTKRLHTLNQIKQEIQEPTVNIRALCPMRFGYLHTYNIHS